jgi:hypothetical protein
MSKMLAVLSTKCSYHETRLKNISFHRKSPLKIFPVRIYDHEQRRIGCAETKNRGNPEKMDAIHLIVPINSLFFACVYAYQVI